MKAATSLVLLLGLILLLVGWVLNVVKLVNSDFSEPYKTEVIRAVGVPIGPIGGVIGWMDIGEENDKVD